MVEKSTYTSASSVTLKSLMPVAVKRNIVEADEVAHNNITDEKLKRSGISASDCEGEHYVLPVYSVFVFRKEIPIILFYLSKGIDYTLDFLEVSNVISFIPSLPEEKDPDMIYFQLSSKCYMQIIRKIFNKYPYVQSIAGAFLTVCTNRVTIEQLDDPKVWIKKIANPNNYEKGKDILRFFNRLLDESTKKILKVHPYHKSDIYTLLRWVMQEYNDLRLKDNLDLKNKRLRCNEYIASLLTKEFSKRLNTIVIYLDSLEIFLS
jgi:sulfatase maturation enzyme AslB (radical SAM superfamily)